MSQWLRQHVVISTPAGRPRWGLRLGLLAAALLIGVPLLVLILIVAVVGVVTFIGIALLARIVLAVRGIIRAPIAGWSPDGQGRQNVRVIRRDHDTAGSAGVRNSPY